MTAKIKLIDVSEDRTWNKKHPYECKTPIVLSSLRSLIIFGLLVCGLTSPSLRAEERDGASSTDLQLAQLAKPAQSGLMDDGLAIKPLGVVDEAQIINADDTPELWLSHGRTYSEQRFSPLTDITTDNVKRLGLAWSFELATSRGIEATPIVVDGLIFITGPWNVVHAIDAKTGALEWTYDPNIDRSKAVHLCCDAVNRGLAVWDGKVFVGTIDGRLIAIEAASGLVAWDVVTVDQKKPYTITGAPRVVKGNVIIGNGGAEYGVRGYVSAYDAETGKLNWRFHTVPGNPEEGFENTAMQAAAQTWTGEWWKYGGGGTVWDSMAYDPDLDLLYIGVGNGSPWDQKIRSPEGGDNLFLSSIVALNPDTGDYIWHYQTTPGETWDYTATQHIILADIEIDGGLRKVLMQAPKNGFFYVIDRETGKLISAENFVDVNWASHINLETGRPVELPEARNNQDKGYLQLPGPFGAHNWQPMAFNPSTNYVYIPAMEVPYTYLRDAPFKFEPGRMNMGYSATWPDDFPTDEAGLKAVKAAMKGYLLAWDPVRQKEAWRVEHNGPWNGGVLTTGGDLVFQGAGGDAELVAYSATTGERLWSFATQAGIIAPPITYKLGRDQYIAVMAGWGGAYVLGGGGVFPSEAVPQLGRLLVFKLNGRARLERMPVRNVQLPEPPEELADEATIEHGLRLYARYCYTCHGINAVGNGLIPDLRYSSSLHDDTWSDIVLKNALIGNGMVGFGDYISEEDSEALRAYVIHQSHKMIEDAGDAE